MTSMLYGEYPGTINDNMDVIEAGVVDVETRLKSIEAQANLMLTQLAATVEVNNTLGE